MLKATNGSNSDKGAIWMLGLVISAAAVHFEDEPKASRIAATAKETASFEDRAAPRLVSHGDVAAKRYGVAGAGGEARHGFPHVMAIGVPMFRPNRASGATDPLARLTPHSTTLP